MEDKLRYPGKDQSNWSMSIFGSVMEGKDPVKPHILDDQSSLDRMPEGLDTPLRDIIERVKFEDARRDHNPDTLTADEKLEIQLFHSFKQDPYFKHYLFNGMRQFSDDVDDTFGDFPYPQSNHKMLNDFPKFDRLNIYDFRRALPQQEKES